MSPDKTQCPPGAPCSSVIRIEGQIETNQTETGGEIKLLRSQVDDLRDDVRNLPRRVADEIARMGRETGEKLKRGSAHFDDIFPRLNRIEKSVLALWILVAIVGLEKALILAWPILAKLF